MKILNSLILSLILITNLLSCKNDTAEKINVNDTYSLQIDGTEQNITGASGNIDDKYSKPDNNVSSGGFRLKASIALADNTGVFISFNNTDSNPDNVLLGDYTTNINAALSSNDFKFGEVTLSGSRGYFSSLGASSDFIKLNKSDISVEKISGEFDAILTNKENNETVHVAGSFTDIYVLVSL